MKRYANLLILLLAGCATLPPAPPQPDPLEGANRLIITTDDDAETAYRRIGQILARRGFVLENTDETLMTISTSPKEVTTGTSMQVMALVSNGSGSTQIELSGQFWSGWIALKNPETEGSAVSNSGGMRGSAALETWNELLEIADAYPDGDLLYARQ